MLKSFRRLCTAAARSLAVYTHGSGAGAVDAVVALFVTLRAVGGRVDRVETERLFARADAESRVPVVAARDALVVAATPAAAVRRALRRTDPTVALCDHTHSNTHTHIRLTALFPGLPG